MSDNGSQMILGTAPQTYEEMPTQIATQIETDTFTESTYEESEKDAPKIWARLVSISTDVPHKDILLTPADDNKHEGLVKLGRSATCDFPFNHKRISNVHCSLYCQKSARGELQAYIEDSSANGTFVNHTRLNKSVRRLLHNGDEVSLINPDYGVKSDGTLSADVMNATFYVHIFLPNATDRKVNTGGPFSAFSQGSGSDPIRSGTVTNLLSQGRNITDYYEVRELLGSGANGQVYRAIHRLDGHEVAVKATDMRESFFQSDPEDSNGPKMTPTAEKILKEAHMMRLLKHPKIIKMEDVFSAGTTLFMVMEMVHGGDLFERVVAKKRYDEDQARVVILQLLSAISYLHSKNVAHRDLKPENILLVSNDSDVDIKVTDFGLAKSADEAGGLKTYCGTPQYFAPEVLNQEDKELEGLTYSLEADMWSVGVIAYALLSGRLPWSDDDRARAREICSASFSLVGSLWDSVSHEAKAFIGELIQVDPARRLSAKSALYHDWFDPISHLRDRYVNSTENEDGQDRSNGDGHDNGILEDMEVVPESAESKAIGDTVASDLDDNSMPPPVAEGVAEDNEKRIKRGKKRRENPVDDDEDEPTAGGPMEVANTIVTQQATEAKAVGITPHKKLRAALVTEDSPTIATGRPRQRATARAPANGERRRSTRTRK